MCAECRTTPCNNSCPNSEAVPVYECCDCGKGIYEGDPYFNIKNDCEMCDECAGELTMKDLVEITEMTSKEILEVLGIESWIAYGED